MYDATTPISALSPEAAPMIVSTLSPRDAKLLAAEILLSDPEALADDVLESCLYILRERLTAVDGPESTA